MALNNSGHVLVKKVEKLSGQHLRTGRGPGPTLVKVADIMESQVRHVCRIIDAWT